MKTLTYSDARTNLASTMDQVCDDHEPVIITRRGSRSVVIMSVADYNSLEETAYLMRSPENARRLRESIAAANRGELTERQLIEPED